MIISIIAAADETNAMGTLDNTLPWRQDGHWQRMAQLVNNRVVIMGKNAWQSREWPELGNSRVMVLSEKLKTIDHPNGTIHRTFYDAFVATRVSGAAQLFIVGGCETIGLFIGWANQVYLTRVHHWSPEPSQYSFPKLRIDEWERRVASGPYRVSHDNQHKFTLERWEAVTWLSRQKKQEPQILGGL